MENETAASAAKPAAPPDKKDRAAIDVWGIISRWAYRNRFYALAFFIPVVLMYISYAIFGLYPFGEKSVLALDLNAQYVYYFEALRDAFWGDGSIFYSWGRNLSGGFMGVIGYYLASPFTLIVMLLPRKMILTSLLLMILCKIGSAGVTMSLYLQRSKHLSPVHATIFSTLFSLSAYMVIQTIDPLWLDGLVFLPLIALGVEYLVDDGRKLNYIIPLALMFVANFYIGYMIGIFTAVYFIYYLCFGTDKKPGKGKVSNYVNVCANFGIATLVSLMLSAFMILPVYNALKLGKFDFTDPDYSFKVQFDAVKVLAQLLTCQYDSVNVQGSPEIYCGILTVVLLPIYFFNSKISMKKKIGSGFLLAVMFFSMYIKPVDMMWHGGQVPNWLPFRYSFIISFILLSMAATAFRHLDGFQAKYLTRVFFSIMAVILYLQGKEYECLDVMSCFWLSIGLAAVYLFFLHLFTEQGARKSLPILLMICISGELICNTVTTLKDVDEEVHYSSKASYESVIQGGRDTVDMLEQIDNTLYRSEKTFTRCINDNLGYGLKGLTHSSSVMNAKTLKFIETLGYNSRSYYTRYDGTTELADSLMGIKYVLHNGSTSRRSLLHEAYQEVAEYQFEDKNSKDSEGNPQQKTYTVYENPNALSIAYMVSDDLLRLDHLGNDNPFNSQNILLSTMLGQTVFDENNQITDHSSYYTRITTEAPVLGAVTVSDTNGQPTYTKMSSGDPTIDYRFTVESDEEILCFLKTENERKVNLWLGTYNDTLKDYKFEGFGVYFDQKDYCIISLGKFDVGTKISLRLTVDNDYDSTVIKEPFFYYFNRDAYQNDIVKLRDGQMDFGTDYSATHLEGTVTAKEDQILFTSIPYEPGWTVKVDGKKVDTTECLKAMIYVPLSAGTHTVTFTYIPPGFLAGVILFCIGIGMLIVFYRYDRENNPSRKQKKNAA